MWQQRKYLYAELEHQCFLLEIDVSAKKPPSTGAKAIQIGTTSWASMADFMPTLEEVPMEKEVPIPMEEEVPA